MVYLIKHAGYRARGAAAGALLGAASGAGLKAYYNKQLGRDWNHNLGGSALAGAALGGTGGFMIGRSIQNSHDRHKAEMEWLNREHKDMDDLLSDNEDIPEYDPDAWRNVTDEQIRNMEAEFGLGNAGNKSTKVRRKRT